MRFSFSIVLIKENAENVEIQSLDFYTTISQARKLFFALSFALNISDYSEIILFQGERKINKTIINHKRG